MSRNHLYLGRGLPWQRRWPCFGRFACRVAADQTLTAVADDFKTKHRIYTRRRHYEQNPDRVRDVDWCHALRG